MRYFTLRKIIQVVAGFKDCLKYAAIPVFILCLLSFGMPGKAQVIWLGLTPSNQLQAVNPRLYGLNIWDGLDPNVASMPSWQKQVAAVGSPILRYCSEESVIDGRRQCWVNYSNHTWNSSVIKTSLQGITYSPSAKLITIVGWPSWMADSNGKLSSGQYANYAAFCASLVQIVNKQFGFGVRYWEVFNEKAGGNPYSGSADMYWLAQIQIQCAAAMKQADPSIKIVAGAWANPYDRDINDFLWNLRNNPAAIDVWSQHQYGGSSFSSDQAMYAAAPGVISGVNTVRTILNGQGFSAVPIWVDEYNIYYDWSFDTGSNMAGIQGGVFAALTIANCIQANNTDALMLWQDSGYLGSRFAAINYSWNSWDYDKLNPSGQVLSLFQSLTSGSVISSSSSDPSVTSVAFANGNNVTWVLVNQSATPKTVFWQGSVTFTQAQCVSSSGLMITNNPNLYYGTLPAESVTFFTGHK